MIPVDRSSARGRRIVYVSPQNPVVGSVWLRPGPSGAQVTRTLPVGAIPTFLSGGEALWLVGRLLERGDDNIERLQQEW